MMSDDSENDAICIDTYENDIYYRKYKLLLDECGKIQKSNEILVFRIQEVNKIVKRRLKEVEFFKRRLQNNYKEEWTTLPTFHEHLAESKRPKDTNSPTLKDKKLKQEQLDDDCKDDIIKSTGNVSKDETKASITTAVPTTMTTTALPTHVKQGDSTDVTVTKRTSTKRRTGRDPNAPKRPSNPFFQFCQEQRQILMTQLNAERKPGDAELTKQELTRQLAVKWKNLSTIDKQVYVDRYERSKEKYAAQMTEYNMKK